MADGHDPRIAVGVQQLPSRNWHSDRWQCMTACILTAFRQLGCGDPPAVIESVDTLAKHLLDDGRIACPGMNTGLMSYCHMAPPKIEPMM